MARSRSVRSSLARSVTVAIALGGVLSFGLPAPPRALAQQRVSIPAERITGEILAAGVPVKWGPVWVITQPGADGVCADTMPDGRGRYQLDIPARAPTCVRAHSLDPALTFVFVLAGENIGVVTEQGVSLESPETLGRTRQINLHWTPIPNFDAGEAPANGDIVAMRFWGQLRLGRAPAKNGTPIDLVLAGSLSAAAGGASYQSCGHGTVHGSAGEYWLDVLRSASGCVRPLTTSAPLNYLFLVNSEQVGSLSDQAAALSQLSTLGLARRVNLQGAIPQ